MDAHAYRLCTPENSDPTVREQPLIDFSSGYVLRSIDQLPKQGSKTPWRLHQNYARDILHLRRAPIEDGAVRFARAPVARPAPAREPQPV